jgi:hypothetical protein
MIISHATAQRRKEELRRVIFLCAFAPLREKLSIQSDLHVTEFKPL